MSLYTWMCRVLALLVLIVAVFQPALASYKPSDSKQNNGTTGALCLNPNGPLYSDDSYLFSGNCYDGSVIAVIPVDDTTVTLTMTNAGDEDNPFYIEIEYFDGNGWINASTLSGVIPWGDPNIFQVDFTFTAPPGAIGGQSFYAEITVYQSFASIGPQVIPVCLGIAIVAPFDYYYDIATACKQLRVTAAGNLADQTPNVTMDYFDDCDTFNVWTDASVYLYDASPIVCRIDGNDTLRFTMYANDIYSDDGFRQTAPLINDDSHESYDLVVAEYMTADSTVGIRAEYFAPKHIDSCEFIVQKITFMNFSDQSYLNDIVMGMVLDWDVPSDSGIRNGSAFNNDFNMIYQFGAEYNQDDSTEALCPQESNDRYAAILFLNEYEIGRTINNAEWVYQNGPYGSETPFPPGPTYNLLLNTKEFSTWTSSNPDSQYIDLSTLVRFGNNYWSTYIHDSVTITNVLLTVRGGYEELIAQVWKARYFLANHFELFPKCCRNPGDTNSDTFCNIGDAVYISGYIFKGGPPPPCPEEGDANADGVVNMGDAVYIINFVFKGGPDPVCGPFQW